MGLPALVRKIASCALGLHGTQTCLDEERKDGAETCEVRRTAQRSSRLPRHKDVEPVHVKSSSRQKLMSLGRGRTASTYRLKTTRLAR